MRNARFTSITAALCAAAVAAATVHASPAGMRIAAKPKPKAESAVSSSPVPLRSRPSEEISPWKNPIKYMGAAVAKVSLPSPFGSDEPERPSLPASQSHDAIALNQPIAPPTAQWMVTMGQIAERQGDIPRARQQYQQGLRSWPGNVDLLRAAARMEDRQGNLPLAENLYQQAVTANPQHAGALNDLGLCLARQGRLDASVGVLEQAIALQPQKALYRNNAATVLAEMRQDQKALAHLSAVHGTAQANYNLGQLLVGRGRSAEAAPYFLAALQHDPNLESAQLALSKLQGGDVATVPSGTLNMPAAAPSAGQQYMPESQPDLQFPATALSPGYDTSSYAPPKYQPPRAAYPAAAPRVGAAGSVYLPPVGTPGPGRQR